MLTVLNEIIENKPKEILVFGAGAEEYDLIPGAIDRFLEKRAGNKIKCRELYRDDPAARRRGAYSSTIPYTQVRYLPKRIREPTHVDIYNNRITLFSSTPSTAIITIIENQELASTFKEYFE